MSNEIATNWTAKSAAEAAEEMARRRMEGILNEQVELLRVSTDLSAELGRMNRLDRTPADVRADLNMALKVAVNAQIDVNNQVQQGASEEKINEYQARADVLAILAANMGSDNKAVENSFSHGRKNIPASDFKPAQIEHLLKDSLENNSPGYRQAAQRVAKIGYEFIARPSFTEKVAANPKVAKAVGVVALTAGLSFANNATPAVAAEMTNTNPTQPGAGKDGVEQGKVVKVIQRKTGPVVEKTDVVPVQTEQNKQNQKVTKNVATIKERAPKTVVQVQPEPREKEKQPFVVVREKKQQTLEINTIPLAERNNKGGNIVRVIPPAPVAPPPATPEVARVVPAPEESAPGASEEVRAAQALMKINHNDLPEDVRNILPKNTNWNNIGIMLQYLMEKGKLTDSQALGPVANSILESNGVNPGQSQIGGPAFGIVQWEGPRRKALEAYAVERNKPVDDLIVQLDFLMMELERYPINGFAELKQAKTSSEATLIFMREFERPGTPHEARRLNISKTITDIFNEKLAAAKKSTDEKAAAEAAKKAADEKAAADAEQAKRASQQEKVVEDFKGWYYPVPKGSPISSHFGPRGKVKHDGEDFGVATGTPFFAAAGGTVKVMVYDVTNMPFCKKALEGFGASLADISDPIQKEVRVTTVIGNDTYETIYAHMSKVTVAPNEIVKAGQVLGETGGSGCSTGPHAHFEVRKNGKPINPDQILGDAKMSAMSSIEKTADRNDTTEDSTSQDDITAQMSAANEAARVDEAFRVIAEGVRKAEALKEIADASK